MQRYMRSSEAQGQGGDDGAAGTSPASDHNAQREQPTQPTTVALNARQQLAEAAKIQIPMPLRGGTPSRQARGSVPRMLSPSKQLLDEAFARRQSGNQPGNQSGNQSGDDQQAPSTADQQMWEDSSINSMFAESVATATRQQRAAATSRYGSPFGPATATGRGRGRGRDDDPYVDGSGSQQGSPPRRVPVKHSKYALRDGRGTPKQAAFSGLDANAAEPEQHTQDRRDSGPPYDTAAVTRGRGARDPDLGSARGGLFRDTDAQLFAPTPLPESEDGTELSYRGDDSPNQRTPRQKRVASPSALLAQPMPQPMPMPMPPPPFPHKRALHDTSLPRVGGGANLGRRERDRKMNRKRNHSPDYDDSMLHSMTYAELADEPFDHDPGRVAVQAPAVPANLAMEDRLVHFKTKEATSQRHFFTEMSVAEWDEAGDWFLQQFSELSSKIRAQRQAKRRAMAEFEAEIAAREDTVRRKAESIERTLGDLRQEGEGMMRNKVVDF